MYCDTSPLRYQTTPLGSSQTMPVLVFHSAGYSTVVSALLLEGNQYGKSLVCTPSLNMRSLHAYSESITFALDSHQEVLVLALSLSSTIEENSSGQGALAHAQQCVYSYYPS